MEDMPSADVPQPRASPHAKPAAFLSLLPGSVILGPMTKGSDLPYRRLCVELGARITTSEMAVARRLRQERRSEFALIRCAPDEPCFGVQLAGNDPDEMGWAAALVEQRAAAFVDLNLGCPIDAFTRKGLGAALARHPRRVTRVVEGMKRAVKAIPVTVKIRLGWSEGHRNHLEVARAAVEGGADAIIVHGRTREARYRFAADWDAVGEVVRAVPVPVVGNGDLLFPHEIEAARKRSGCAAVMVARGALIKPWIFREASHGYVDLDGEQRLAIYRRYVALALEHWGTHDRGRAQVAQFLRWHLEFWYRYAPRGADGVWPSMQERQSTAPRTPLERLLARNDEAALSWLTERLLLNEPIDPDHAACATEVPLDTSDRSEVEG
jgi:tRNA-dihydrouridine synthase 3